MGKTSGSFDQISNLGPQQQQLLSQFLGQLGGQGGVGNLGNLLGADLTESQAFQGGMGALTNLLQGDFDPGKVSEAFQANVAAPAIEQFQQELAPSIQQAAVSAGGGRSSAVPARTGQAAERLSTALSGQLLGQLNESEQASLNRQQNAISQALGFAQAPGQQQAQQLGGLAGLLGLGLNTGFQENTFQPGKQGFGGAIGTAAGAGAGSFFGNPLLGAQLGGQLGSAF